jgi:hypothetical protein
MDGSADAGSTASDIHRDAGYARLREMLVSKAGLVGKGK